MIERVVTVLARALVAALALACLVGLAIGARGMIADGFVDGLRGGRGLAVALAAIAGAVAAVRGWGPARVLAAVPRRAFLAGAVVIALASGVWAHHAVVKGVPDVPDELGCLHTARTFAAGELIAPSPPATEFFFAVFQHEPARFMRTWSSCRWPRRCRFRSAGRRREPLRSSCACSGC